MSHCQDASSPYQIPERSEQIKGIKIISNMNVVRVVLLTKHPFEFME